MPEPGSDSLDTSRFGIGNRAGARRQKVNGNDLLQDATVGRRKLARDCFPPDPTPLPEDVRPPAYHEEPDRISHEQGPVDDKTSARGQHNHDYAHIFRGEDRVMGTADSDYTSPFTDAEEGPNPFAPTLFHLRTAVWNISADAVDRIRLGPIAVWTRTSLDGGTTWGEPTLRAVCGPGETQVFYEVRDVEYDPAFYAVEPVVEVMPIPVRHARDGLLKLVRAGWDGKIDEGFLPPAVAVNGTLAISSDYTTDVDDRDLLILVDASGGTVDVDAFAGATDGFRFAVKKVDSSANVVTVTFGIQQCDGQSVETLANQYQARWYEFDGTTWHRVSRELTASGRNPAGVITTDDLIVDFATKGLVLKDTQGTPHYWRVTVSTLGALVTTDLGTSPP